MLERITTLKTRGTVRTVVGAPGGGWVLVVREATAGWSPTRLAGAELYRRTPAGLERACEPPAAATMFVLDDGTVIGIHDAYNEVEVVRHGPDGAARGGFVAMSGISLGGVESVLEADGAHATVAATDRDDGHGWTQPVYTPCCTRVDLQSGARTGGDRGCHLLRGPGVPTRSPHDGGDGAALQARIAALPFRREWPLRVGPSRLLTTARVIGVLGGETVLGVCSDSTGPRQQLFDLSADERLVVAADASGRFELHDLARRAVIAQLDPKYQVRCAAFLTPREIVVGTAEGRILLLGLPD